MPYNADAVASYSALNGPFVCPTCPYCNGTRDATIKHLTDGEPGGGRKPSDPWLWWRARLNAPRNVCAPMVDQSELPFRMLCRKYGTTLAYTPMFHAGIFSTDANYRRKEFTTCPEDRPVFVQFCAHDADVLLAAARHVEDSCDAVDINLGCPQGIAKRGHYGAFLMEHWDTVHTMVHTLAVELRVPVTVKMRLFDEVALSVKYAKMLREAGAWLVAVHGRTRDMKGQQTGIADMAAVATVRAALPDVPVIANGNTLVFGDIERNLRATGADAAMSAEALLWDPRLFSDPAVPVLTGRGYRCRRATRIVALRTSLEYLEFVERYPVDLGFAKAHLFKTAFQSLNRFPASREALAVVVTTGSCRDAVLAREAAAGSAAAQAPCDGCEYGGGDAASAAAPSSDSISAASAAASGPSTGARFEECLAAMRRVISELLAREEADEAAGAPGDGSDGESDVTTAAAAGGEGSARAVAAAATGARARDPEQSRGALRAAANEAVFADEDTGFSLAGFL